jgi:predicted enzyme related to lactoylglutathione lyase
MSERDQYQASVPCWVDTAQPDPEGAIRFYGELFGWQFAGPGLMPGEPPGQYFVAQLEGRDVAGISSPPPGVPPECAWNTYVAVDSADDAVERAKAAGGTVVTAAFDAAPAGRMAVLRDPAGALFCVWEAGVRQGAQRVNEPAAWSMSLLHTSDPSGSEAFYSSVFGWEPEPLEMGGGALTLWRLPGYVGGEPQQPVPRDVVGLMLGVTSDQQSDAMPAHWSVDFWVHDADGVSAQAPELGGKVIVPPHDTPGFRNAVIADPSGAAFSVSQLTAGAGAH